MTSDKPKHKPNTKHTLEEVLKSLHDLIRNDLVSATAAAPAPGADRPPAADPSAAASADDFSSALDKLDEIITHKIIEPVERARREPPALEVVDDEIVWDEEPAAADGAAASAAEPEPAAPENEDIVLESPREDADGDTAVPGGKQEMFSFDEAPEPEHDRTPPTFDLDTNDRVDIPQAQDADLPVVAEPWEETIPVDATAPADDTPANEPAPSFDTAPPATDSVDVDLSAPMAPSFDPLPAPPPESPASVLMPGTSEYAPATASQEPTARAPAAESGIPVLNEVAHEILARTYNGTLLSPERIREITIQVSARLNIELRQTGGQPLDARTIHRLQQLLRQALTETPPSKGRG